MSIVFSYRDSVHQKLHKLHVRAFSINEKYIVSSSIYIPQGKVGILKCPCGGNDWSDNGRHIHEYECVLCGQYIEVFEE